MKRLEYAKSSWSLALRQWPTVLMTALTAAILTGCKDDLGYETVNGIYAPKGEITFYSTFDSQQREPMTRHMGHLSVEEEEWELTGLNSEASDSLDNGKGGTRVDASEDLSGYFANAGVKIFLYDGTWGSGATGRAIPSEATSLHGTFNSDGLLSPEQTILWTQAKKDASNYYAHMRAYAFGPLAAGGSHPAAHSITNLIASGNATFNPGAMNTRPTITYTVPDAPADQADLIAGYTGELDGDYGVQDGNSSAVPMTFRHVLSAIQFKIGFGCWVKSIKIEGVYKKGTGYIDDDGSTVVTPDATAGTYSYTYNFTANGEYTICTEEDGEITSPAGGLLTGGDLTLMMIPQTLPSGAKVTLRYSTNSGATYQDLVCSLEGYDWQPGYRYTYVIKEKPSYSVYFDLAAGNISFIDDTYRGYVYKNTSTTPEIVEISGTHTAENKYYVYQSIPKSNTAYSSNPGYNKGWTGDLVWDGSTQTNTVSGSTLVLPQYSKIGSPLSNCDWSDWIVNRDDVPAVIDNAFNYFDQQRAYSPYLLNYQSSVPLDIVFDNLYYRFYKSISIGHAFLFNTNNNLRDTYVTIRLKGDNLIQTFIWNMWKANDSQYFNITSYYGDKAKKGSLTMIPPNKVLHDDGNDFYNNQYPGIYGGQHVGLFSPGTLRINGGIIYVGGFTDNNGSQYIITSNIAGGANTGVPIEINGGSVTSVSYDTGAAIGGGGGFDGAGGPGKVTINGGEVYAYAHGATCDSGGSRLTPTTAIGGGSTFGNTGMSAEVTITGGYVYAQSIGGVAIGGGNSGGGNGGDATIRISGGVVCAKSISGVISNVQASKSVVASTSLGGGTGGDYAKRKTFNGYMPPHSNGGNAYVTLSGGTLITGTMGGGKGGYLGTTNYPDGYATFEISGCNVQGQANMQSSTLGSPSFTMTSGTLSLSDKNYTFTKPNGGAVWMDTGICTFSGGTISGFTAQNGGAVYMEGGTFNMNGGSILDCSASYNSTANNGGYGGAVYINDVSGNASVNITGGTISNCFSTYDGGAIYLNGGSVTMSGGTIQNCKAVNNGSVDANGGGIYVTNGGFTMTDGNLIDNACKTNGAGVYVGQTSEAVSITGGTFTGNVSENVGGAVCVIPGDGNNVTVTLGTLGNNSTPLIESNTAIISGGGLYAEGSGASVVINGGTIRDNIATSYVYNSDVANEGGVVTLNGGIVNHITIKFMPGAGNASWTEPKNYDIVTSTNSYLTTPTITRPNFTFVGWRVDTDGDGVGDGELLRYTGDKFSVDSSTGTVVTGSVVKFMNYRKDVTLIAQWQLGS